MENSLDYEMEKVFFDWQSSEYPDKATQVADSSQSGVWRVKDSEQRGRHER